MAPLSGSQFGPWTETGPAHAQLAHVEAQSGGGGLEGTHLQRQLGHLPGSDQHEGQGQLFPRSSVPYAKAHEQTPDQFAKDDRTWWHGRYAERLTKGGSDEGFHAGTRGSADKRLRDNYGRRSGEKAARLFPLRLTGETANRSDGPPAGATPDNPAHDSNKHNTLGSGDKGYFYDNLVEGRGLSVGVDKREGKLSTHREMVDAAKKSGESVHPSIAWAAKKAPAHTNVDAMAHKRWAPKETSQLSLTQFDKSFDNSPTTHSYDRRQMPTEGGRTQSVWRQRGGNANEPHKWEN